MKVTFLGTGTSQGVPVIACACQVCKSMDFRDKRLRTSVHIELDGLSLVIDTGTDFRQQMLRANIQQLDAILFTHQHKDHTGGLDDIRPFYFKQRMKDIPIYAHKDVIAALRREYEYIFSEKKYPGIASVETIEIENQPFYIKNIEIIPIQVMHHKLPIFGFRFKNFTYITDANYISPEEIKKIEGTEVLVLNALHHQPHLSHFTLAEALEVAKRIGARQTYFTHISHQMGLHRVVEKLLPPRFYLAYDGLVLTLD
ncbi:MAG: MBL fold metallo-hydrolase [Flammeovirgaceae bacterium]|nr:MBL fold metallo-hydrolase [Flammeovirgaceae bacterium]MDW8287464.1 MBL fold metallo-hydrolase [Flammeovirgaceae bacterium]